MRKNVEMIFEFKNEIPGPPQTKEQMREQSTSNDEVTVNAWRKTWIDNVKRNKERFGNFKEYGLGRLFGINKFKPCIVIGSGPSLANNIEVLKQNPGIMVISCLHNYQYMVDNDIHVDYYVSLDAGDIVIEEISEGGAKTHADYVESTKGKKLISFIGSSPKLYENWKGEIILFNCSLPDDAYQTETRAVEEFHTYVSTGGNVFGAATYIAKAIFGSNPIVFMGADFSFSYTRKFHAWDSKYDGNVGEALRCVDIWGNSVLTWQSYYNFKVWFDWVATHIPGIYINCTEGGLMGSYPEGNIKQIKQMALVDLFNMYNMHEHMRPQCEKPEILDPKILF